MAESALTREVESTDLLQTLSASIETGSQHFGFKLPDDFELADKAKFLAIWRKSYVSRMYRAPFEHLSRRLGVPLGPWPSYELPTREHNDKLHEILEDYVDNIVGVFDQMNRKVDAEQRHTIKVRAVWQDAMRDALAVLPSHNEGPTSPTDANMSAPPAKKRCRWPQSGRMAPRASLQATRPGRDWPEPSRNDVTLLPDYGKQLTEDWAPEEDIGQRWDLFEKSFA